MPATASAANIPRQPPTSKSSCPMLSAGIGTERTTMKIIDITRAVLAPHCRHERWNG